MYNTIIYQGGGIWNVRTGSGRCIDRWLGRDRNAVTLNS